MAAIVSRLQGLRIRRFLIRKSRLRFLGITVNLGMSEYSSFDGFLLSDGTRKSDSKSCIGDGNLGCMVGIGNENIAHFQEVRISPRWFEYQNAFLLLRQIPTRTVPRSPHIAPERPRCMKERKKANLSA